MIILLRKQQLLLSEYGTLTGKIIIPENLSEGTYQIGFEPQIFSNKTIYIGSDSSNQKDISIRFNSTQYVFGDDISFSIENSSLDQSSLSGKQIHWAVEFNPVDGIPEISNGLISNVINWNQKKLLKAHKFWITKEN